MEFPDEIVLEITKKDTEIGLQGDCSKCPTALALWRLYPDLEDMLVDYLTISLAEGNDNYMVYLPSKDLTVEMHLFDSSPSNWVNFRPGKYTLKLSKIVNTEGR